MTRVLRPALAGLALAGAAAGTVAGGSLSHTPRPSDASGRAQRPPRSTRVTPGPRPVTRTRLAPRRSAVLRPVTRLTPSGAPQTGLASYYDSGATTASGQVFDPQALTAASPSLPFGTELRVCVSGSGDCVLVHVNDRGPYVPGRFLDLTPAAAGRLGYLSSGVADVTATPVAKRTVLTRVVTRHRPSGRSDPGHELLPQLANPLLAPPQAG